MSVFDIFRRGKVVVPDEHKDTLTIDQLAARYRALNRTTAGASVTPNNAMKCTTVHGIVRALTNAMGSYPVSVGQEVIGAHGRYVASRPKHALNKLLRRPNAVQASTQFYRMVMQHACLHGNFYAIKGQGASGPINFLRPIEDPSWVTLDDIQGAGNVWGAGPVYKVENIGSDLRYVPGRNMLHITSGVVSENGIMGVSPVELAKEAIGLAIASEQLMGELYGNGALPALVLTGGRFSSEEQYQVWVDKWNAAYGQGSNRGGTALLPEGMDAKEISFKPMDAQVLETRKFQRIEIAQVYGVPPHKLADLERATFSNIEEQSLEFVRDVAKPWVELIQQCMRRDLFTEKEQNAGFVVRFDMEGATEGKFKERVEGYGKAHEIGAMNPNEIRQRLGFDPRDDEGGEAYATPLNMRTTEDAVSDNPDGAPSGIDDEEGEPNISAVSSV